MLQLYTTPWISDRWSERDILFCEEGPKITNTTSTRIDVQHPFVTKTYRKAVRATSTVTLPSGTTIYSAAAGAFGSSTRDDSVNLLTLAKIFIEIRSSHRIEDLLHSEDFGPHSLPNEAMDLQTPKRCMVQESLSFASRGVIAYCMKCFADPDMDLKDQAFRQSVIESVLVPLLENLYYLQGEF